MVSLIKNQLLKHLSRFTKNLSPDKINVSTFRGEGDLSNLQLDENVLTELLELPSWIRLTSAWCNHVSFRITWTKLKSVPIILSLDEVTITIETCEFGRNENNAAGSGGWQSLTAPQGKYNFINKIIDGITITINTVNIKFHSPAFTASVQMSRIRVESKTPKWLNGDLRVTRLKDGNNSQILIFKELSWQTVRIEASSTQDKTLTPLRLLTNQARCRITIKKKMSDCTILASRLVLILDDLLWVLTDSQLNAALHFVDSLTSLIKQSTSLTQKTKAKKILERLPEYQAQVSQSRHQQQQQQSTNPLDVNHVLSATQRSFNMFDVKETSYHFFSQRIDLHLCDDAGYGRSCYPDLSDGGALQISVQGFQIDYYPFHLAKSSREHWPKYKEAASQPALWLQQSLNTFRESLLDLCQPNRVSAHAPLERSPPHQTSTQTNNDNNLNANTVLAAQTKQIMDNLMTSCVVLRIENFTLYRVSTSGKKQMPKEFISGDKERYSFPTDLSTIHAEFTYFYFPGDFEFPLPPSKIFIHLNPVQVHFHLDSLLWLNSFALNLHENLLRTAMNADAEATSENQNEPSFMYMDVKLESIMPRVIIESIIDAPSQRDRPKIMQIQISRLAVSNIRETGSSRADLANALHALQEGSLVFKSEFPAKSDDISVVTDRILSHVAAADVTAKNAASTPTSTNSSTNAPNFSRYALWVEPRDVWCIKLDPIWIDFLGARSVGANKSVPFVDAVPITFWIHGRSPIKLESVEYLDYSNNDRRNSNTTDQQAYNDEYFSQMSKSNRLSAMLSEENKSTNPVHSMNDDNATADLHIIAHVSNLVSVQMDHYQYLFLLRLAEEMTELSTFLAIDSKRIQQNHADNKSIVIGCVVPQVEITMVMPSQTPGKESTGGDGESVLPDSASLGDDLHFNNGINASGGCSNWPLSLDQMKNHQNTNTFGSIETPSPVTNELNDSMYQQFDESSQKVQYTSSPNAHGFNVQIVGTTTNVASTPQSTVSNSRGKNRNSITDSGLNNIGSSLISMKKGFSSFMTSIDSALKTNISDDVSDTISIQSDISSDSENFAMVLADDKTADCMDVMFRLNPFTSDNNTGKLNTVEVASEVCEEGDFKTNASSPSEPSEASTWRRRDLVSMATFRLTTVEFIRQNCGPHSSIRAQVAAISCDECGAIPWDELQTTHQKQVKTKFGARCRAWQTANYNQEAPPSVQLRLNEEIHVPVITRDFTIADKKDVLSWFTHNLDIRCQDLALTLSMSTVIGLNDLTEDEIISKPLPMELLLNNLKLTLIEDRPPVNITSPGVVPLNLQIGQMHVKRNEMGIFEIQPKQSKNEMMDSNDKETAHAADGHQIEKHKSERDRELIAVHLIMQQLKLDNDKLKTQLNSLEKSNETNANKIKQESDELRSYLKKSQDNVNGLLDEKRKLLETVRGLRQQLVSTDRNNKNDSSR